eukprot:TRINITY_DN29179_c0_g1_i1.p3 TRINITY_DN29179_c0_g1~~TRINITY_DN29179_c0_g1_i1.p3  ORF type:complete len:102 (+),score=20.08 TRINITY_DN29179_c0_g1_i1:177-482(+)
MLLPKQGAAVSRSHASKAPRRQRGQQPVQVVRVGDDYEPAPTRSRLRCTALSGNDLPLSINELSGAAVQIHLLNKALGLGVVFDFKGEPDMSVSFTPISIV